MLVMVTAISATLSYVFSKRQPPVYQATTTMIIGQIFQSTRPDRADIQTSEALVQTYADIARRQPVLQGVVETLNLDESLQDLRESVQVEPVTGTQLFQVQVESNSPEKARAIADEVAHQLILLSPTNIDSRENDTGFSFIRQQTENLEERIIGGQERVKVIAAGIAELQARVQALRGADITILMAELAELQNEKTNLEGSITEWGKTYAELITYLEPERSSNYLSIVEPAQTNSRPVRPRVQLLTLIGSILGACLAFGLIFLLEYLDDTFTNPEEITHELGLPVLGLINDQGKFRKKDNKVFVYENPHSPIAEAYRSLRANLEFADVEKPLKTIMISSADIAVGKTSVATNLAVVMAQGEKSVILVDADMRKSSVHTYAKLPRGKGLSDMLRDGAGKTKAVKPWKGVKNVHVVTGGKPPKNPAELLGSDKMTKVLSELEGKADVVIIDSPPFVVSDPLFLATNVDGVLLVIRPGHTKKRAVLTMIEQLNRAGARIIGVILNRVPARMVGYYGGYLYHPQYYNNGNGAEAEDDGVVKARLQPFVEGWHSLWERIGRLKKDNTNGEVADPEELRN